MKPFCTGDRGDVELLQQLQDRCFSTDLVNPFFFSQAVAPMVAARGEKREVALEEAMSAIKTIQAQSDFLLVEGCGGLLVPLGPRYTVLDLIIGLDCPVLVVSPNRLGTINHTLLTVRALQAAGLHSLQVVLMGIGTNDSSAETNPQVLQELLTDVPLEALPFFAGDLKNAAVVQEISKKRKKPLARITDFVSFSVRSFEFREGIRRKRRAKAQVL
jgi:dethiobiotin synthetase